MRWNISEVENAAEGRENYIGEVEADTEEMALYEASHRFDWDRRRCHLVAWPQTIEIDGHTIQIDRSGQGHCWVDADADSCPPHIQQEIAEQIIDAKRESGEHIASNGLRYRWS